MLIVHSDHFLFAKLPVQRGPLFVRSLCTPQLFFFILSPVQTQRVNIETVLPARTGNISKLIGIILLPPFVLLAGFDRELLPSSLAEVLPKLRVLQTALRFLELPFSLEYHVLKQVCNVVLARLLVCVVGNALNVDLPNHAGLSNCHERGSAVEDSPDARICSLQHQAFNWFIDFLLAEDSSIHNENLSSGRS